MMIGFWKNILNCCGTKSVSNDNVTIEDISTIVQDWRYEAVTEETFYTGDILRKKNETSLSEVLNEEPKVLISNVIVKYNTTSLIFQGSFDIQAAVIKIIPKAAKLNFEQEMKVLKKTNIRKNRHLNIVQFLYKSETPKFNYIVTEFYGISLKDYTESTELREFYSVKKILRQMTNVIDHLKDLRIVKLNLDPSDIYISPGGYVKITNFMNCKVIRSKADLAYSKDILSFGYLFYFLLTNGDFYQNQETKSLRETFLLLKSKLETSDELLCLSTMINIFILSDTSKHIQLTAKEIREYMYFWNEDKTLCFFRSIVFNLSFFEDNNLRQNLLTESYRVIGTEGDWQLRIEREVLNEISEHVFIENNTNDIGNIIHLLKTISKLSNYPRKSPALVQYMGTSPEELINYWVNKFPYLLLHLQDAVISEEEYLEGSSDQLPNYNYIIIK